MLIAGLLTCSMIIIVFAPQVILVSMFGDSLTEPLAQVVVRSWGFLIFTIGALLIYSAYKPEYRNLSLIIASVTKISFITLIAIFGYQYIEKSLTTILLDATFTVIFLTYLVRAKHITKQAN